VGFNEIVPNIGKQESLANAKESTR